MEVLIFLKRKKNADHFIKVICSDTNRVSLVLTKAYRKHEVGSSEDNCSELHLHTLPSQQIRRDTCLSLVSTII